MSTPILPFAVWASGTNQNSIPANDNSLRSQILNGNVISDAVAAQPASPADGDIYILPAAATGTQWAAFDQYDLVIYQGGTWYPYAPVTGIVVNIAGSLKRWDGAAYAGVGTSGGVDSVNGLTGAVTLALDDLDDVDAATPSDGDALVWDEASGTWVSGPGGGGSFTGGSLTSAINWAKGADIASAAMADIGAATGNVVRITGTTNISGFGMVQAGTPRVVVFDGVLTLIHNATSLILPGGANITTAAGDCAIFVSEGSGNWRCVNYQHINGSGDTRGKQSIFIAAAAMRPAINSGCAQLTALASGTGQPDMVTLDFDPGLPEYAQFSIAMPNKWNKGAVTFQPIWSHAATTSAFAVVWSLQAVAVSNDDPIGVAFGSAVSVNDAGGTTDDLYVGPESAAITVAGSPADGDMVFFRVSRVANNGSDTMAIDARLHGIQLFVTTDADTDA